MCDWSEALREFGRLVPGTVGDGSPSGTLARTVLGPLQAYRLSGTPQSLRRSARSARQEPADLLRISVVLDGYGIVCQNDSQVRVMPGQLLVSEAGRPFDVVLKGSWRTMVLTVERDALPLPREVLRRSLRRTYPLDDGPGGVLAGYLSAVIRAGAGPMSTAAGPIGEAGLYLIAGLLGASEPPETDAAADAQRIRVLGYVRAHLTDPGLTHSRIAAAHHMAPRTLHRLFEDEAHTVTEYVRLRRLAAAHGELADPRLRHLTVAGIAARWGFASQAHFTRAFQARYGVAPSSLRRGALGQTTRREQAKSNALTALPFGTSEDTGEAASEQNRRRPQKVNSGPEYAS
ncbi:helix-turn-helix domain-containing protein [Actinoplanes sp. TBRC 11911]|uniref:helix-turn-helix domain-containing protein n=1 Tax=Actinoplanes sp. TBRC 11911 TaxID=2729386 RepID=UPI00145DAFFB|nr:helix-turn-helix domain-containing protein [Actinoplanes sp. TBRC 11911]NMO52428.1 helix-turn-helix domain-containing protein [Actinoplanes sp. TBRC 11911]